MGGKLGRIACSAAVVLAAASAIPMAYATAYVQTDGTNTTGGITIAIASGDTLEISGKVTGSGRLTTSGSGTLILSNGENDWTGGIKVGKGGKLRVTAAGALGGNAVQLSEDASGADGATITFAAPGATFANAITVSRSGSKIAFAADTVLEGAITANNQDFYMYASSGTRAVVKGNISNGSSNTRQLVLDDCKGRISFEGKISSRINLTEWQQTGSSDGGVAYLCNTGNAFGNLLIGSMAYVCSNENVIAATATVSNNRYSSNTGRFDLNGFDQTIKGFGPSLSTPLGSSSTKENVTSVEPATLTLKGDGAGTMMTCNFAIQGKVSLCIDSASTATNKFLNRVNGTAGDIVVNSGCLWLTGGTAAFTDVASVSVGSDGAFVCDSAAAHPLPDGVALSLDDGAEFALPAAVSVTVSSLTVGGVQKGRGTYTSANCPEIRSGAVVVDASGAKSAVWTGEGGGDASVSTAANWSDPTLNLDVHNVLATFASCGTRAVIDRDVYFAGLTMNALDFTFADGGGRMLMLSNNLAFAALDGTPARTNVFAAPMVLSGGLSVVPPAKTVVSLEGDVSAAPGTTPGTVSLNTTASGSAVYLSGVTIEQKVAVRMAASSKNMRTRKNTSNRILGAFSVADASLQILFLDGGSELAIDGGGSMPNGCSLYGDGRLVVTNLSLACNDSKELQISANETGIGRPELVFAAAGNNVNLNMLGYGGTIDCRASGAFTGSRYLKMGARWDGESVLKLNSTTQSWAKVTVLKDSSGPVRIVGGTGAKMCVTGSGNSSISATSGKVAVSGELSIAKSGSGTLTLSNCSFGSPGVYEVSGGTLALSQGMLDSGSTLKLSGSGTISIADGELQKFAAVYADGDPVLPGTYSYASASAALKAHMADTTGRLRITGGGFVIIYK